MAKQKDESSPRLNSPVKIRLRMDSFADITDRLVDNLHRVWSLYRPVEMVYLLFVLDCEYGFLVHYHRQFQVESDVTNADDMQEWMNGETDKEHYLNDYHIFCVSSYIHSGVCLRLGEKAFAGQLPQGHEQFDVSHCGAVLSEREGVHDVHHR